MLCRIDSGDFLRVVTPALREGDPTQIADAVVLRWVPTQICQLLDHPAPDVRGVAAFVLGLVGNDTTLSCLTKALRDPDPQVNQMAEHALWSIWFRRGRSSAVPPFRSGMSALADEQYTTAVKLFNQATTIDPEFAEAFNQCAIAHFFLGHWSQAVQQSRRTLALVPEHFGAMAGMGHSFAHLGDLRNALKYYTQALRINPRLTKIENTISRIKEQIKTDTTPMPHAGDGLASSQRLT